MGAGLHCLGLLPGEMRGVGRYDPTGGQAVIIENIKYYIVKQRNWASGWEVCLTALATVVVVFNYKDPTSSIITHTSDSHNTSQSTTSDPHTPTRSDSDPHILTLSNHTLRDSDPQSEHFQTLTLSQCHTSDLQPSQILPPPSLTSSYPHTRDQRPET